MEDNKENKLDDVVVENDLSEGEVKEEIKEEIKEVTEVVEKKKSKIWMLKLIPSVIGIILGIVVIVLGSTTDFSYKGFSSYDGTLGGSDVEVVYHKAYGGDAYTGIQNAAADAANNAAMSALNVAAGNYVLDNIDSNFTRFANQFFDSLSFFTMLIGIIILGFYIVKFTEVIVTEISTKRQQA